MGKFENTVIITDLDGTLLTNDCTVSQKDIEAIEFFKKEGGLFTVATGRTINRTYFLNDYINLDIPAIFANGGIIGRLQDKNQLWIENSSACIKDIIIDYYKKNTEACILISSDNKDYIYNIEKFKKFIYTLDGFNITYGNIPDIPFPFVKTVIISEKDLLGYLNEEYSQYLDKICFTKSSDTFYEIVDNNVNKGNALLKLKSLANIQDKKIIAVGDNLNDIEFIENSDIGVAVLNNCTPLIQKADITVNKGNVIYQIINKLM